MKQQSYKKAKYKKLHLGSGNHTPSGWVNVDGSWNAWLAKFPTIRKIFKILRLLPSEYLDMNWNKDIVIHDITKPLPFSDDSFIAIYSSHTLEHLYREDALKLLKESHRVLKKNGVIRKVVPDLESAILEYIGKSRYEQKNSKYSEDASADRLQKRIFLRESHRPKGNILTRIYNTLKDYNSHKWMYDAESLTKIMKEAGFKNLKQMPYNKSKIKGIEKIEKSNAIIGGVGLCIEGVKK